MPSCLFPRRLLCLGFAAFLSLVLRSEAQNSVPDNSTESKWSFTGSLLSPRIGHTATLLQDGDVLIVGGWSGTEELSSAELFDLKSNSFRAASHPTCSRTNHTATLLANGKVLVVGGQSHGETLAEAELYDPISDTWTETGSLHLPRSYHTATLLSDGKVLVAGGTRAASPPVYSPGSPPGSALAIAELYDPESGKWSVTENLHFARYVHTATLLRNGQVLVTGGFGVQGSGNTLSSAELYNPKTSAWTITESLSNQVVNHTSTLLPDGEVLVTGGWMNGKMVSACEKFDPLREKWTQTGSLLTARNGHTATALSNGEVLITGGAHDPEALSTSEIYDPTKGTWTATSELNGARGLQTATLLNDGQVLVTGGFYATGSPAFALATAELFRPTKVKPTDQERPTIPNSGSDSSQVLSQVPLAAFISFSTSLVIFATSLVVLMTCLVILLGIFLVLYLRERQRK